MMPPLRPSAVYEWPRRDQYALVSLIPTRRPS